MIRQGELMANVRVVTPDCYAWCGESGLQPAKVPLFPPWVEGGRGARDYFYLVLYIYLP